MKNKLLAALCAITLLLAMTSVLSGCNEAGGDSSTVAGEDGGYTVTVTTKGGMPLSGIDVYVYADKSLKDMKQFGETDENGKVSFQLPDSKKYAITLSGAPKGYEVEKSYAFNGTSANIQIASSLIKDADLTGATLGLGDVMYDFTVTTPDGKKITLSEVLKTKKMVLLNFWYTTCSWCLKEFPYMEQAYQKYKNDIEIIALDPMDNENEIRAFQQEQKLSFPMAACQAGWSATFGISGYPTSIAIDRYGVICLIEAGGITSMRPFTGMFDHFTADNYKQKICKEGIGELVTAVKPTYKMDSSENIGKAINSGDIKVTYRPETEDKNAEFIWPFILTEKGGKKCLKASNQQIESSSSILYADVELKAGQAIAFDYLVSSEKSADVLYVIVDNEDIYQVSGVDEKEKWTSCYPFVATKDGTYKLALCYLKDESGNEGDDTAYIRNMQVVDKSAIDTDTYIPRDAAVPSADGKSYSVVDLVFNSTDGYYHVGSKTGPLLLANLMSPTQFNESQSIFDLTYDGKVKVDGKSIYEILVDYCSYASNSALANYCTVNKELAELLKTVVDQVGFGEGENEWLKLCKYYEYYGPSQKQLEDPIKGLSPASAYKAKEGKNVSSNYFYYNRPIMPRGLLAEFIPTKSGVYRITSRCESQHGVDAWIFNEKKEELYTYEAGERMYSDDVNCSIVYYMEAGKKYYIDIAFWDYYETGYIYYDIEYIAKSHKLFRLCSPGYFTYDTDATGNAMYYTVSGGIKAVLGSDGYYYHDLGNGKKGSRIYADFTGLTSVFDTPISTVTTKNDKGETVKITGMIDKGGFDFSKTENDLYVLAMMEKNGNDVKKTDEYFQTLWGESYDEYAEEYELEDVYEGKFHGEGEDMTAAIKKYLSKIEKSPAEREGCVPVDKQLAEILQKLMDKYTFENVEQSWLKVCYYYDQMG